MSAELPFFDDFCSNASFNSTQEYFWELDKPEYGVATACILLLYFFVGLPLNFLVAGTILLKKLYKQPAHILLFSLSLSDSVLLLIYVPQGVVTGFAGEFVFGNSDYLRCKVCHIGIITTWFAMMSLYTISLMSLDRFLFIYIPLHYQRTITLRRMTAAVIFVWIFCTIISILPIFGLGQIDFTRAFASCTVNFFSVERYYFGVLLVAAIFPLVMLVICNVWVVVIVLKNIKAIYSSPNQHQSLKGLKKIMKQKRHKKQLHLMQAFGSLLIASLVSWLPVIVTTLVVSAVSYSDFPTGLLVLPYYLMLSQVVTHPAVEMGLISAVKEPIKIMLRKILIQIKEKLCCSCVMPCCSKAMKWAYREGEEQNNNHTSICCSCNGLNVLCTALVPDELYRNSTEHVN